MRKGYLAAALSAALLTMPGCSGCSEWGPVQFTTSFQGATGKYRNFVEEERKKGVPHGSSDYNAMILGRRKMWIISYHRAADKADSPTVSPPVNVSLEPYAFGGTDFDKDYYVDEGWLRMSRDGCTSRFHREPASFIADGYYFSPPSEFWKSLRYDICDGTEKTKIVMDNAIQNMWVDILNETTFKFFRDVAHDFKDPPPNPLKGHSIPEIPTLPPSWR